MNTDIKNWKISTKLYLSFSIIIFILLVVGLIANQNINLLNKKTLSITQSAPFVDAAMEMKIAVANDINTVFKLVSEKKQQDLHQYSQLHQRFVRDFDTYAAAILEGAKTDEGMIYRATDQSLRNIVIKADKYHNDEFQPAVQVVFQSSKSLYQAKANMLQGMSDMESAFRKIIEIAEKFEMQVKSIIKQRIQYGSSEQNILKTENTWADMAMEIKITLAMTRIAIEEYVQESNAGHRAELEEKYQKLNKMFDQWINALLNGATTTEGTISAVTIESLRQIVVDIDKLHDMSFQKSITYLIEMVNTIDASRSQRQDAIMLVDGLGKDMMKQLGGVEDIAKTIMRNAEQDSHTAASSAEIMVFVGLITGLILSIFLAIIIPPTITKTLGGEPAEIQLIAENIANGDLTTSFSDQKKASGVLASMQVMNNTLLELISKLVGSSSDLASTATQTATISEQTNVNIQNQNQQIETIAAAVEQMSASVNEVASNASETSLITAESEQETEKSKKIIQNMITIIQSLSDEINDATRVIHSLQEKSDSIGTVSEVISGIAEQTNLLALNAAIEAARAGEAGRGFAVVADEVRSLASKTQESITSIDSIIEALQAGSRNAVTVMEKSQNRAMQTIEQGQKSDKALQNISQIVDRINEMNTHIATAMKEQASVTDEISSSIQKISQVSQDTSIGSREIVDASEKLLQQAELLKSMSEQFKV